MTLDDISELTRIFESKNWELDEKNHYSKFNRICQMVDLLKDEKEKRLLINLTNDFLHITQEKYGKVIIRALNRLLASYPNQKKFYILPLIARRDLGKNKSAFMVHYLFKGTTMRYEFPPEKVVFKAVDHPNDVPPGEDVKMILVDDFVGTADTAIEAIDYVMDENKNLKVKNIIILSIVSLDIGCKILQSYEIPHFYSILEKKGITDKYNGSEITEYKNIMEGIESRFKKLQPDFKLGYKQSEALVCMERTPNNTFPIFWLLDKKNTPPFPR